MKKILAAVAIGLLMLLSYVLGRKHTPKAETAGATARHVLYWVDPMHPDYKSDHAGIAPDCGMQLEPVYADSVSTVSEHSMEIAPGTVGIDADKQQLFGIRVGKVEKTAGSESVRVLGRVVPEDTRVFRINAGMEGFVRETFNDSVGELVKKDQKLATCYGADSLAVASGFLAATAAIPGSTGKDGSRTVAFPGAVNKQGVSSIQGYTDRLLNLGMSEAQIKEMAENRQLPESIDILAPANGFILGRNISPGMHFDRSMEFYRIADLSKIWIVADIFGTEAGNLRPGTVAHVISADSGRAFTARITNILPQVDPATRTLKLRLEADNPGFALRPDMFVDVALPVARAAGLTVPADAVIDSGREQRVFVERSSGVFEPRLVQVGWRSADRVEILQGLSEGERVVASGTFLVDSESRLKSGRVLPKEQPSESAPKSHAGHQDKLAASTGEVKDASCGMTIDAAQAAAAGNTVTRDSVTYYFCSESCKRKFSDRAERDMAMKSSGPRS